MGTPPPGYSHENLERLCVSSISLWKLVLLNDREKGLADGVRTSAYHLHLGDRGRGEERLEEPEDPGEERRNVDEELARLSSIISHFFGANDIVRPAMKGNIVTYEELRIVVLEDRASFRGSLLRVGVAATHRDTFVVFMYNVGQRWRQSPGKVEVPLTMNLHHGIDGLKVDFLNTFLHELDTPSVTSWIRFVSP